MEEKSIFPYLLIKLSATKTGTYYIVVTGDNLTGKIKAKWKIH